MTTTTSRIDVEQAAPELYRAMLRLDGAVGKSGLDPELQDLLKFRVAQMNGCAYCMDMHGRDAVTHWEVLERYPGADGATLASLLACRLSTGRTHQIRVHLAYIGHPVLGDINYGSGYKTKAGRLRPEAKTALEDLGRQALHAYLLGFEHPLTGDALEFRSELPGDLLRLRHSLGAT